ncbi:UTP-glucose-1-phosphate uridylyltransferase GtaB [Acrasis kona]|uniref:UTP--glucose-1-phosphate uridylyltransferase n=1 Tax=Acrasis kona TaxID=1008807 RepID=A0AAW2ZE47_9EUKA
MVNKVVIPIAGWGTRMFPASKVMPKALFPIVDHKDGLCKPILHIIIEDAVDALKKYNNGNEDDIRVCIVLQESQRQIMKQYFDEPTNAAYRKPALETQIAKIEYVSKRLTFVVQKEQLGFGHAVLCAKEFIGDDKEPFLVMLGDHVYTSNIEGQSCVEQVLNAYKVGGLSVTSIDVCDEVNLPYNGVLKIKDQVNDSYTPTESIVLKLETTIEKPSVKVAEENNLFLDGDSLNKLNLSVKGEGRKALCYFGIDLLPPALFNYLEKNLAAKNFTQNELNLRDAMRGVIENEGMNGVVVRGRRYDTGMPDEYVETLHEYHTFKK